MFKTVIFDLDGTLLNTLDDLKDSGNRVCEIFGWPIHSKDEYRYFVGNGIPKLVERFTPLEYRKPETLSMAQQEFNRIYSKHMYDKTAPYPGIESLLKKLYTEGVMMAVFSNKANEFARFVIERYFDKYLFKIIRGALLGVPTKPKKEGTLALLHDLGLKEGDTQTLYVGDSDVDVETAHNAFLRCCGVLWGFRNSVELKETGADYLVSDTEELKNIILN